MAASFAQGPGVNKPDWRLSVPAMHSFYLDAIRNFEGYTPQASWDYAQFSNGFGTRARFAGEVIDRAEAERRFQSEVSAARTIVEKTAGHMDEGTKAALTSLTYNAGTAWIGSGLGDAVRRGDLEAVREIFVKYNKAGGEVLPGLVSRRAQEALWIGNPDAQAPDHTPSAGSDGLRSAAGASAPAVADGDRSARQVAEIIRGRSRENHASEMPAGREADIARPPVRGTLDGTARQALAALVGIEGVLPERAADIARLAQLGRGSALARADGDRQNGETRRV